MSALLFLSLALLLWAIAATGAFYLMRLRARDALTECEHLEGWVHHNLRAIRAGTEYAFPEAVSVCNSLEMALPLRARVDVKQLDQHLAGLRREHNAQILDGAGYASSHGTFEDKLRLLVAVQLRRDVQDIDLRIDDGLIVVRVKGGGV